tara:strand:- start:1240 stop:2016 length:777 start_codon:yes stop_codon:yes gene_type:complete
VETSGDGVEVVSRVVIWERGVVSVAVVVRVCWVGFAVAAAAVPYESECILACGGAFGSRAGGRRGFHAAVMFAFSLVHDGVAAVLVQFAHVAALLDGGGAHIFGCAWTAFPSGCGNMFGECFVSHVGQAVISVASFVNVAVGVVSACVWVGCSSGVVTDELCDAAGVSNPFDFLGSSVEVGGNGAVPVDGDAIGFHHWVVEHEFVADAYGVVVEVGVDCTGSVPGVREGAFECGALLSVCAVVFDVARVHAFFFRGDG